jgi:(p)ppGpp synthase/HD superfamily hydrolase
MASWSPIDKWNEAVLFVVDHHGDDLRKGTRVPYVTHVMAVAESLAYHYPDRDGLILAGLLHDVVEDTEATFELVEERFGLDVTRLVRAVSKDDAAMASGDGLPVPPKPRTIEEEHLLWRRRREFMLEHIRSPETAPDVLRLKAADALANLTAILRDLNNPAIGSTVWRRFKVGREDSLWFYEAIATAVEASIGQEPIARDLRGVLTQVADVAVV